MPELISLQRFCSTDLFVDLQNYVCSFIGNRNRLEATQMSFSVVLIEYIFSSSGFFFFKEELFDFMFLSYLGV